MADEVLAERYGRTRTSKRRERTILVVVAAAFAVVFVAWVVWAGLDGTRPTLEVTDTGHRLLADERAVEVRWDLAAPVGSTTACVVQALNEDFVVVGWKVVEIPASDEYTRTFTETVRTAQEANTGLIYRCWLT
ncbi:DUF4307 domain-containing protein [Agromyces sp. SYSU T00194]|uniref:DUF4307 domain-containing protein n=1 Tax=Agromyces chitinivorans TaxID=3158560 RepID=UPI00339877D5